jgi:sirohydrochlorin cobaltochelatase
MAETILPVGFGALEVMRNDIQNQFPDRRVITAKTAADGLRHLGADRVFVQPLYLLPGFEYEKLRAETAAFAGDVVLGKPLLHDESRAELLAGILAKQYDGLPTLFVGHGTAHLCGYLYTAFARAVAERFRFPAMLSVLVGTPDFEAALCWAAQNEIKRLRLVPLMMSAGKHVQNEIIGSGANTWSTRLKSAGIEVSVADVGLLDYAAVRQLVLRGIE